MATRTDTHNSTPAPVVLALMRELRQAHQAYKKAAKKYRKQFARFE